MGRAPLRGYRRTAGTCDLPLRPLLPASSHPIKDGRRSFGGGFFLRKEKEEDEKATPVDTWILFPSFWEKPGDVGRATRADSATVKLSLAPLHHHRRTDPERAKRHTESSLSCCTIG